MADAATKKGPVPEHILDRMSRKFTVGDGCWEWTAGLDAYGYGMIQKKTPEGKWRPHRAHRLMYEFLVGPIPEGMTLDHLCRNRKCLRPDHLEPVPLGENVLRGVAPSAINARKDHCINGHPFDEANTIIVSTRGGKGSGRRCKACAQIQRRIRWATKGT